MIKSTDLIRLFRRMYEEHWKYEWGAHREGCVDCSGAFVWAYGQLGANIYHGSNTIYRKYCGAAVRDPRPGYAAFKIHEWTDSESKNPNYGKLPGDVYHIGLVDETGEYVLNAKSVKAGFSRDPAAGWHAFAPLNAVIYDEEGDAVREWKDGVCTADNVRVRLSAPSGKVLGHLDKGDEVQVGAITDGWACVRWNSREAYVFADYVDLCAAAESAPVLTLEERVAALERAVYGGQGED